MQYTHTYTRTYEIQYTCAHTYTHHLVYLLKFSFLKLINIHITETLSQIFKI